MSADHGDVIFFALRKRLPVVHATYSLANPIIHTHTTRTYVIYMYVVNLQIRAKIDARCCERIKTYQIISRFQLQAVTIYQGLRQCRSVPVSVF